MPLPTQAVELLRKLHLFTGHSTLVFQDERADPTEVTWIETVLQVRFDVLAGA